MKYGWIEGEGRFFFLMSIIDVFTNVFQLEINTSLKYCILRTRLSV
ncbi:hypothetical protein ACMX2M_22775 [Paenibacillus polymyxa]|nr:hypothetical protein [Paenibacillus amylolyticus]MCL6662695.1 hypothetical protein [Paenibacillus amylolyticus]